MSELKNLLTKPNSLVFAGIVSFILLLYISYLFQEQSYKIPFLRHISELFEILAFSVTSFFIISAIIGFYKEYRIKHSIIGSLGYTILKGLIYTLLGYILFWVLMLNFFL